MNAKALVAIASSTFSTVELRHSEEKAKKMAKQDIVVMGLGMKPVTSNLFAPAISFFRLRYQLETWIKWHLFIQSMRLFLPDFTQRKNLRLVEEIYNRIILLNCFDGGTKSIISPFCGLVRGNPQFSGILGLYGKSKMRRFNFLVDLKVQSKHRDKNCPNWMYTKLFEVKKWLNMEPKTDKESRTLAVNDGWTAANLELLSHEAYSQIVIKYYAHFPVC